jgi:hypothetical protein
MTELLIPIVLDIVKAYPWFPVVTSAVALASAVAAVTPTPKAGSTWSKVYKVVDIVALNFGKAKQK